MNSEEYISLFTRVIQATKEDVYVRGPIILKQATNNDSQVKFGNT
jgi:hypothetical protein